MSEQKENKEQLKGILGEPIIEAFTENLLRIRRNLLIVSSLSLVLVLSDIKISGDGSFIGLKIEGITEQQVFNIIFWATLYHLIHFVFEAADYTQKWRLRLTGNRYASRTSGEFNEDYSYDPTQSTLYNWWKGIRWETKYSDTNLKKLNLFHQDIIDKVEVLKKLDEPVQREKLAHELKQTIQDISHFIKSYQIYINSSTKVVSSERITVSLERFDRWFWNYQIFQLIRLFVIEFLFPVVLSLIVLNLTSPLSGFLTIEMILIIIFIIIYFACKKKTRLD